MEGPSVTTEAATAPAPQSASDKAADFENFLFEDEQDDTEDESDSAAEEGDDLELEAEEAGEDEDEPATAIDPPASLNAEEKAKFSQLPEEAQRMLADVETRRNTQVQEATTKASEAQRTAEARAAAADADAKAVYANQLDQFVAAFEPDPIDPRLAQHDPGAYIAAKAQYDANLAQHYQLVQHVRALQSEAETEVSAAFTQERDRELMTIPQIANPETRDGYVKGIMELADAVGFAPDNIAKNATGQEFKALASIYDRLTVAETKAAKYDAAMAKQMQKVRASKGKNLRPGAPHAEARRGTADWQRVKTARSKEAQAEAFADFMGL